MLKKSLILFSCALFAGMVIGWNRVDRPVPTARETTRLSTPRTDPPRPVWGTDDFVKLARERMEVRTRKDYNPLAQKLADWTDEEIIAALNASLTDPDVVLMAGGANGLDGDLLGEWMGRDFEAALAWFGNLESRSAKGRMANQLSQYWPRDQADRGLAFLHANLELFPGNSRHSILEKAFENASENGPAAMGELLRILRESGIGLPINPWRFPPDFDFATLGSSEEIEAIWGTGDAMEFIQKWIEQDRDAAFNWMMETHGAGSMTILFKQRRAEDEDWLAGKFGKLNAAQRAEFAQEMKFNIMGKPNIIPLFQNIHDPAALQDACKLGADLLVQGNVEDFMPDLEDLKDPSLRISLLENASPIGLNDNGEALLRQKLADWKASSKQIESIVIRLKP